MYPVRNTDRREIGAPLFFIDIRSIGLYIKP